MRYFLSILLLCLLHVSAAQGQSSYMQQFSKIDAAYAAVRENDLSEAFKLSLQQDSIARLSGNDSLQLLARFHKAQTLIMIGFQDIALKELYSGLKKAEQVKSTYFEYRYNYSIGQAYDDVGDYTNAIKFYNIAKQKTIENGTLKDTLFINPDIAHCHLYLGNAPKSLEMLMQNLAVSKAVNDSVSIFFALDNLAGYYAITGDLEASLASEREILNYPRTINSNYRKNILYSHMAEISKAMGDWPQAKRYCDSMFKYATLVKSASWLSPTYRMRSIIDEANKDYKSALDNFRIYHKLNDSLNKSNYDKKMSVMTTFYELDKKQNQIDKLGRDRQISVVKIERLTLAIVVLILLSVLLILYGYYRKNRTEKLLKDKFAVQLLDSQEAERQRLAKELHDSLGQNIMVIKNQLQGEQIDRNKLLESVALTLEEIRTISKDLYPNQLEKYGLAAAVEALGEQVQAATGIFVSSDMQDIDETLNKNTQINLYRIIQEFFNNTIKHANATAIRVTMLQTREEVVLVLKDNGDGFNKDTIHTSAGKSFGLLNMEERVKILKGRFEIDSEPGGAGTQMILV